LTVLHGVLTSSAHHRHVPVILRRAGGVAVTDEIHSGVSVARLTGVTWKKSARSGAVGNCVELARLDGGGIAVRNSRFPDGPALIYTPAEMAVFLAGVKDGEFDDFVD
jgi:hypothetical protein